MNTWTWEIFPEHISDKRLLFQPYKELFQLNNKMTTQKLAKVLNSEISLPRNGCMDVGQLKCLYIIGEDGKWHTHLGKTAELFLTKLKYLLTQKFYFIQEK